MADNQNISATPYPFYATGGNDDDSFRAALTSHVGASVERNQDAGFASLRSQATHRDVVALNKDGVVATADVKFELANQVKDSEIRAVARFSELKDLIHAQAARDLAEAKADLREQRVSAQNDKIAATLAAILTKLS